MINSNRGTIILQMIRQEISELTGTSKQNGRCQRGQSYQFCQNYNKQSNSENAHNKHPTLQWEQENESLGMFNIP